MATPRADTYSAASGAAIYAGMAAPAGTPAWRVGAPLNAWMKISGTDLKAAKPGADAYSGAAIYVRAGRVHITVPASGGHLDSSDNSVVGADISNDVPAWGTKHAASPSVQPNVAYYANHWPTSRHLYWSAIYVPQVDRVLLFGLQFGYGGGTPTGEYLDGFNPANNQWDGVSADQPGLSGSGYANLQGHGYGLALNPANGDVYGSWNYYYLTKWDATTKTQTVLKNFNSGEFPAPFCWDAARNQLLAIGFGNGAAAGASGLPLTAYKITADGQTRTAITFNASAALTEWVNDCAPHAALVHDTVADRFFWFSNNKSVGKLYVITPNAGSVWDVAKFTFAGGGVTPPTEGGVYNRLAFVPDLGGLVYAHSSAGEGIYFMRTA